MINQDPPDKASEDPCGHPTPAPGSHLERVYQDIDQTPRLRWHVLQPIQGPGRIIGRMPLRALLMRLFLVVALLANAPGIAGASIHVADSGHSGAIAEVAARQQAAGSMRPCHEAEAIDPAAVEHAHAPATAPADDASPADDCCQAGDCCACMHVCSAALAWSALADRNTGYRQTTEPFLSGHASAVLTNLLRPPIG